MTDLADTPFTALILAGSRGGVDPVAAYAGVSHKALVVLEGETLLTRVAHTLTLAGATRIVVSTNDTAVRDHAVALGAEAIASAEGPSLSVRNAIEALGTPLLVTTADHALLQPEWIRRFRSDLPPAMDVVALLARRESIEAAAPGTRRTYLRFADGDWSGCNLFYLATPRAAGAIDLWRQVEVDRKRPWRIVRRLGLATMARYLTRRLTLAEAVARLGRLADVRATAVESPFGLAAVDVDTPNDLDLVRGLGAAKISSPARGGGSAKR
ncbi:nucleotidyltransferase family protein [Sphingomonas sp. SUN019]|uniref:nucleotidyltransferase family protein n=1 Tax=Sphingomonas sp. SUN019 TaxID=2937788 RepID=UPI0021640803|nr:nucleotidyltransferase family protein [Sphingomonas sp. SUN019]UVO50486.1 nucleotidyltransferase family protein [Sphingomonas sp. SUN019]